MTQTAADTFKALWDESYRAGASDALEGNDYDESKASDHSGYFFGYGDYENGYYDPNW